jgi:hypothetical protein
MAVDNTSGVSGKTREVGKGFFNKSGRLKSKEAVRKEDISHQAVRAKSADSADFSSETKKAFKKIKNDIRRQANEIFSLANEKGALIDSAASVNQQQLKSAKKIKSLLKDNAPPEDIAKERKKLNNLQKISEELEEEIVVHNIESSMDQHKSIRSGNKTEETFKLEAVEYRAVQTDTTSLKGITNTISALKENRVSLIEQKTELADLRTSAKEVTKAAIDELSSYSENAIKNVEDAQLAAQNIAEQISAGSFDFLASHSGLSLDNSVLNSLFEEELN